MIKIPIENIYYLLCYAWNKLEEKDTVSVDTVEGMGIYDLFAKVLRNGISYILRKGLDRGYLEFSEDINRIRGKIDFSETVKRNIARKPVAYCSFDELSHNIVHNRILRSTIRLLINSKELDSGVRGDLIKIYRRFQDVDEIDLSKYTFNQVRLNRNNRFYDFLLKICELISENLLITEEPGRSKFRDFLQDESAMGLLFEEFVRNFYKKELKKLPEKYVVTSDSFPWSAIAHVKPQLDYLPSMNTDISIYSPDRRSPKRRIIIDTKFYSKTLQTHYGKDTIHSQHLYQMFSYLKNLEQFEDNDVRYEGILLYPTVDRELNLNYEMHGHRIDIRTINLNQEWQKIHNDLIKIIN